MKLFQIAALIAMLVIGVSTDAIINLFPPNSMGVAMAADEPKRVDFTLPFMDDDKPIIDEAKCPPDGKGGHACETPLTLGEMVYRALRAPEQGLSFDEGVKREDLAHAVRRASEWPLLSADRETIKRSLARVFPSPALLGPASKMLDGK